MSDTPIYDALVQKYAMREEVQPSPEEKALAEAVDIADLEWMDGEVEGPNIEWSLFVARSLLQAGCMLPGKDHDAQLLEQYADLIDSKPHHAYSVNGFEVVGCGAAKLLRLEADKLRAGTT